jgi:hypothetical protein
VLVVLETGAAVVANFATGGSSVWLWPLLGLVVAATCALVWRQHRRRASARPTTRVRVRAGVGGAVEDSPTDVPGRGDVDVATTASWWGRVRRSGTTVRR